MSENTKINDGGPAFGQVVELKCVRVNMDGSEEYEPDLMVHGGLTVRDWFAGKALPVAFEAPWRDFEYTPKDGLSTIENNARLAYQIADAMIAARNQPSEPA